MGKRNDTSSNSSESEDEKSKIARNNPKKQISQLLLQAANKTSKNQLLQRGLKYSDIQDTVNKKMKRKHSGNEKTKSSTNRSKEDSNQDESFSSSDNEDEEVTKSAIPEIKISVNEKRIKKQEVSTSSEDETFLFTIKKTSKSGSEDSESNNSEVQKKGSRLEIKKRNSSSSESEPKSGKGNNVKIREKMKKKDFSLKIKKRNSSSSESEAESEKRNNLKTRQKMKKKVSSLEIKKRNWSSSESEVESDKSTVRQKVKRGSSLEIKRRNSNISESEAESEKINNIKIQEKMKKEGSGWEIKKRNSSISESEVESAETNNIKIKEKMKKKGFNLKIKKRNSNSSGSDEESEKNSVKIRQKIKKRGSSLEIKKRESSSSESQSELDDQRNNFAEMQQKIKQTETISDNANRKNLQIANEPHIKKEIKTSSSSSESESESDIDDKRKISLSTLKQFHRNNSESSSSKNEEEIAQINHSLNKNIPNKFHKKSLEDSTKWKDTLHNGKSIKQMEKALKNRLQNKFLSGTDSDTSVKSKVTVLQNIRLSPEEKQHSSQIKGSKERLEMKYPGLTEMKIDIDLNFSGSNDVYLLRIPKNIDPNRLMNVEFDFENDFKLKIGEKYDIKQTAKIPDPTLVVSDTGRVIHFKSNIKMDKHIKLKKEPKIVVPEKKTVPLPDNLKNRHPLFGSNFKDKISLSKAVEQKLEDAVVNLFEKEEKVKKKKHKKRKLEQEDEQQKEKIFEILSSHSDVKRIKKETSDDSAFSSSGSMDKIGKKNKKSKQNILDEILNIKTENDSDSPRNKSSKKKRKRSTAEREWEEMPQAKIKKEMDFGNIKTEVDTPTSSNRGKKRSPNIVNSTVMLNVSKSPQFSSDLSRIGLEASTSEKKPKKSKKIKDLDDNSLKKDKMISEILHTVENDITPKKVKKKKKHKELD